MRPAHYQNPPSYRRSDSNVIPAHYTTAGNADATLRPDDPHIKKVNKQSFDKQRAIEQLTRGTGAWQDWNQDGKTDISYHFKEIGGNRFSETQKQEARRSIQSWGDVANLTFTENGSRAEGRLSFQTSSTEKAASGFFPSPFANGGDTVYNPDFVTRPTITHEIGHALGLTHPGDYNITADDTKRLYAQDSKAHTVMSYYLAQDSGKTLVDRPKAPMMDDISAIQHKYGANHQTRRENNTYGFNSNSGRDYYSLRNHHDPAVFCVWDGAGNDTLDFSGYGNDQVINLNAGSFSDVGGYQGNVSIARDCDIENAIGGSGHDALIGNDADNRLTGGGGADRLRGGRGADTFVYNHARDSTPEAPDEIMDFTSGLDKIDVSGALRSAGLASLSLVSTWSGKGGEARLSHDEKSGEGMLAIDLTGNGKPDLLIKTHGRVRPGDILPANNRTPKRGPVPESLIQPVRQTVNAVNVRPHFVFKTASDSTFSNARLFTDFTSGTDKLDLRGIEKEAKTRLTPVNAFSGRAGETIVGYNPQTYRYFVAIDLTGNGTPDFLVKSTQEIKPKDILVN
ncbi:M10 family metallopeptidase C-terminal domain-containing protein [Pseudomonas tolaasii]|uniref:M10 family metallopeptidase C-terminal domain-containing protein n=1 Tax=Pseudomonas tolaasii TaxID=29442 RepID=UPI0030D231C0